MSVNREIGKTDDLRLQGLLTGGGAGGYMYNYGPSGAPSNMPPTAFQQGLTRGPVSMTGMSDAQMQSLINQRLDARALSMNEGIDAPDQRGEPTELGDIESIFEILAQVMAGTQGTIGGLDPETVAAIRSGIDPSASAEELQTIAQQILDAGGYEQWLATQGIEYGDILEPDTGLEPDTEFPEYEQVLISLEEFQALFEGLNPSEYEDGMYTDPATGIVYVINMPPDLTEQESTDAGDVGGGGAGGGTAGGGDDTSAGGSVEGGEGQQAGINDGYFRVENGVVYVKDLETNEWIISPRNWEGYLGENPEDGYYTDAGVRIDDDDEVNVGGTDQSSGGGNVTITPGTGGTRGTSGGGVSGGGNQNGGGTGGTGGGSQTGGTGSTGGGQDPGSGTAGGGGGSGTGTGPGGGSGTGPGNGTGGGQARGMFDPKFRPYMASIGYQPVAKPGLVLPRYAPITNGLFSEYFA